MLRLMSEGLDTAEIAGKLCLSERAVKRVIFGVTSRLNLRNRAPRGRLRAARGRHLTADARRPSPGRPLHRSGRRRGRPRQVELRQALGAAHQVGRVISEALDDATRNGVVIGTEELWLRKVRLELAGGDRPPRGTAPGKRRRSPNCSAPTAP